ncbi:MAG TPA: cytochrome C oxidase subunit IV family protein [Polyangiaceae bacterium]|nr:cytochrome C oxidase subunit IV family protein [Polyangiaceae bacterium]
MNAVTSGRRYFGAWFALVVLTTLSLLTTDLVLHRWAVYIALTIAAIKAGIVLVVFMHLAEEPFVTRFIAILNVLWVALLCLGIAADVLTR